MISVLGEYLRAIIIGLTIIGLSLILPRCGGGGSGSDRGDTASDCSPRPSGYNKNSGKWECS
jgi:hypothetical protein